MYGTTIQQGTFTAVAAPTTLKIRSGVDWIKVYDPVNANAAAAVGFEYFWQRGMANGTGAILFHGAASTVVNSGFLVAPLGFSLFDTSTVLPSAAYAVTAGDNNVQPTYSSVAGIGILGDRAIVRLSSTLHNNLNGLDFTVTLAGGNDFQLANALATAPGVIAGGAGFFRLIANNLEEYTRFYPGRRVISNITQAAAGVVTTLVDHGLVTGQTVRLNVPEICEMTEINGQLVTVTVLTASTFSINVDTTGYSAFVFPTAALIVNPVNYAEMVPVGVAMAYNTITTTAADHKDYMGIKLGYDVAGTGMAPAGIAGHTMYWIAGKSVNV